MRSKEDGTPFSRTQSSVSGFSKGKNRSVVKFQAGAQFRELNCGVNESGIAGGSGMKSWAK